VRETRSFKMDKVINIGIPHVGEQIFESVKPSDLVRFFEVSQTWKALAENVFRKKKLNRWKGRMLEVCISGNTNIVELLLIHYNIKESGLNAKGQFGMTPFMMACHYGHEEIVQLFLNHTVGKIDFNAKESIYGRTAFTLACIRGHKKVVKLLLNASGGKIDWNAKTDGKDARTERTAFMMACIEGQKDVVELLLNDSGGKIDFNAKDNDGWTGFELACGVGCKKVVQLILDHSMAKAIKISNPPAPASPFIGRASAASAASETSLLWCNFLTCKI